MSLFYASRCILYLLTTLTNFLFLQANIKMYQKKIKMQHDMTKVIVGVSVGVGIANT